MRKKKKIIQLIINQFPIPGYFFIDYLVGSSITNFVQCCTEFITHFTSCRFVLQTLSRHICTSMVYMSSVVGKKPPMCEKLNFSGDINNIPPL